MKRSWFTAVLLGAVLAAVPGNVAAAGPVEATSEISPNLITVGDPVLLTLTIVADSGFQIVDPGVGRAVGDFEVLEALPAEQTVLANGALQLVFRYQITTFRLGRRTVDPITVAYLQPDGLQAVAQTEGHTVAVTSVVRAGEDISDIKPLKPQVEPPQQAAPPLAEFGFLAAGVLGIVGLGILAIRLFRRHLAESEEALPPKERALGELRRIDELALPEQGRAKEHYALVGQCLRRYVRHEYGVDDAGKTPRELRGVMVAAGVERFQALMIDEILVEGEIVRFGHLVPSVDRAHNTVRVASEVIQTALDPEPAPKIPVAVP